MSSEPREFYNLPLVEPVDSDSLLLGREGQPKRASVAQLLQKSSQDSSAIAFSQTPPTEPNKLLWIQVDSFGFILERWRRLSDTEWISEQSWNCEAFEWELKRDKNWAKPNPVPGDAVWIESLTVKCTAKEAIQNSDRVDCFLKLINSSAQRTAIHYIRVENKQKGEVFNSTEQIGLAASINDAIGLWLSAEIEGKAKIRSLSIAARVRRYYATN